MKYALPIIAFLSLTTLAVSQEKEQADSVSASPDEIEIAARDPFVRGLKRLDNFLRLRDEIEQKNKARIRRIEEQEERDHRASLGLGTNIDPRNPPPISEPSFIDAFDPKRYRLDGLLISQAPIKPVIHIVETSETRTDKILYWSGRDRRWIYSRGKDEKLNEIARKFTMLEIDLLNINGTSNAHALHDEARLFVSPRDNGPLIHIVRPGETVKRLAKIYDMQPAHLTARNRTTKQGWLLVGQRVLVRDKTITASMAQAAVAAPTPKSRARAAAPRKFYARIGQYKTETKARRAAAELYVSFYDYMDSDIVIRREQDPDQAGRKFFNIDIGPMRSTQHAEAYCALYRQQEMPCLAVQRLPTKERVRNFESQAIVSVSPYVLDDDADKTTRSRADLERLKLIEYNLAEGQELGNAEGLVAKITATEIFVIDRSGFVLSLPLAYIPEIDPTIQPAAPPNNAGLGDALGAIEAPNLPEGTLVERLTEGEGERREGSTEAAEQIVETEEAGE